MITIPLLLVMSLAQEGWIDTHRIVLRNGNFVDGVIESLESDLVVIKYSPTGKVFVAIAEIQKDDKGRPLIQEIRIRHASDEAKVIAPPTPTPTPEVRDPLVSPNPTASPTPIKSTTPEPPIDPAKKARIEKILTALSSLADNEVDMLKKEATTDGPDIIPYLIWRLETLKPDQIVVIFEVLKLFRDTPLDERLLPLLRDKQAAVRAHSARLLATRGYKGAIPRIVEMLRDTDTFVRTSCAGALEQLGDPETLPALAELALDKDPDVRASCAGYARSLAKKTAQDPVLAKIYLDNLPTSSDAVKADLIFTLGAMAADKPAPAGLPADEIRAAMLQAITEPDERTRTLAINALASFRTGEVSKALLALLTTESSPVALVALCGTLGAVGGSDVVLPLIQQLQSASVPDVKSAAAAALRLVSKQDFGQDGAKWMEWYEQTTK